MEQDPVQVDLRRSLDGSAEAPMENIEMEQCERLLCSSHVELIPKTTGAIHDQKSERTNSFDPDGQRPKWEYTGWRAGGLKFSIIALVVLVTNFISLIWSVTNYTIEDGYSVLYSGNCATGRKISTALHLLINILSTTLLTASNYIMQCLSSPTREDLDRAHAGKEWADIGIPSWRNRRFVSPQKRMLWWLLGISSIPLHFLYNSAVFLDVAAQQYHTFITTEESAQLQMQQNSVSNFTKYDYGDCKKIYSRPYVMGSGNVYFIIPDIYYEAKLDQKNGSVLSNHTVDMTHDSATFILSNTFIDLGNSFFSNTDDWSPWTPAIQQQQGYLPTPDMNFTKAQYCYSEVRAEHCKIKVSTAIMTVVILCNISKVTCMFITIFYLKGAPLVTLGDAIESFLKRPDHTTKGLCLVSKEDIQNGVWTQPLKPKVWQPIKGKQYHHTNTTRWIIVNSVYMLGCLVTVSAAAAAASGSDGLSAFQTGIGFATSLKRTPTILSTGINTSGTPSLFLNIILANLPQSIFSFMNVLYNALFTTILLLDEWNSFALKRQPLRVTQPSGQQKSKSYISIPYHYGIPIILFSAILHWLISESLFLVRITAMSGEQIAKDASISAMGYSALALLLAFLTCFTMLAFMNAKALRNAGADAPLVGSCSAAIGAACHSLEDGGDVATGLVQWGVVRGLGETEGAWKIRDKDFGHCSFSAGAVAPPIPGRYYAGVE